MNYNNWLNDWLGNYVKPAVKSRTYERYLQVCRLHIMPALGGEDMGKMTTIKIQKFVTTWLENGNKRTGGVLSANFVNLIISIVQNSIKTAHIMGIVKENVASKIKRPRIVEKSVDCFSLQEQKKIEKYVLGATKPKLFGVLLCLYTGLRIGELLALTWDDIDVRKGMISVSKTCYDARVDCRYVRLVNSPKTLSSERIIPLPKQLLPMLKSLKRQSKCEYVVADNDKPVFVRSYQRTFELLLKKLKIDHKGFHSLRHTFATRALECGMDVKTLSEILGHKNAIVTLNRYAHSLLEHKVDMMNRLGKLL